MYVITLRAEKDPTQFFYLSTPAKDFVSSEHFVEAHVFKTKFTAFLYWFFIPRASIICIK